MRARKPCLWKAFFRLEFFYTCLLVASKPAPFFIFFLILQGDHVREGGEERDGGLHGRAVGAHIRGRDHRKAQVSRVLSSLEDLQLYAPFNTTIRYRKGLCRARLLKNETSNTSSFKALFLLL